MSDTLNEKSHFKVFKCIYLGQVMCWLVLPKCSRGGE
jgi:hypothetical protein